MFPLNKKIPDHFPNALSLTPLMSAFGILLYFAETGAKSLQTHLRSPAACPATWSMCGLKQ